MSDCTSPKNVKKTQAQQRRRWCSRCRRCSVKPRAHETVFCHQSLMEMSETNVKTDRPYTRHSKVSVTGCPLYTSAEIRVLLWLVRGGGAACSLKYEREAKTFLKTKIKLFTYNSTYTIELRKYILKLTLRKQCPFVNLP